ncbi:zinc finger BED domain-containing protein RICESLEEPER 2 [Tanacetum coccineum]
MFPVLSRMAMDIISVQASSVASESAFSTSGRVLSIRRTRLTSASLEMCMCLKDHLDAKERKQDKCPLETPLDFEEGVFDDEVQQNEAIPLSDEEIALDASSEGTMSPRGPRYDYMINAHVEPDVESKLRVSNMQSEVAFDLLRDALSAIFGLSELKEISSIKVPKDTLVDCVLGKVMLNNYDNESSDDDNDDDDVEKDEEDGEKEEHLALADPSAVPINDHVPLR